MILPTRLSFAVALALGAAACSSPTATKDQFTPKAPTAKAERRTDGTVNDHSLCDWKNKPELEASETAGPGSVVPNVRRVYQIVGIGDDRHKVLICREIDTNFDGVKDVVRRYNEKGESLSEEADSNFDGRIDTWITFVKGRLSEVKLDTNWDGNPDEWKYYSGGKLSRVTRDTNHDGKPDVWEIYREGKLERMGVDIDGDEHVDRWDHDNELRRRFEDAENKKEADAAASAAAKKAVSDKEGEKDAADADAAAPSPTESSKRKPKKK